MFSKESLFLPTQLYSYMYCGLDQRARVMNSVPSAWPGRYIRLSGTMMARNSFLTSPYLWLDGKLVDPVFLAVCTWLCGYNLLHSAYKAISPSKFFKTSLFSSIFFLLFWRVKLHKGLLYLQSHCSVAKCMFYFVNSKNMWLIYAIYKAHYSFKALNSMLHSSNFIAATSNLSIPVTYNIYCCILSVLLC